MNASDSTPTSDPCVRLFLSVDLAGSTRLKNILNQQQLWTRFRAASSVVHALRKRSVFTGGDAASIEKAVLTSLEVDCADFDWAAVIEAFYAAFQQEFVGRVESVRVLMQVPEGGPAIEPWKAIGDELIYVFHVRSRREIHWLCIAFLAALRTIDGAYLDQDGMTERHGLRLKGSGWVAGFPVRNRRIRLPGKTDQYDYLGPEIDTGFRLGKCTRPAMLAVSVELAEFLAEIPTTMRAMTGMIVGWEKLKGVWDDKHYPVIWVELPDGHLPELQAKPFDDWELQESAFSRQWNSRPAPKPNLPELCGKLEEIRSRLPSSLGIVDPYIVGDLDHPDVVDEAHQEIQRLMDQVNSFRTEASVQDVPLSNEGPAPSNDEIESIVNLAISGNASADSAES